MSALRLSNGKLRMRNGRIALAVAIVLGGATAISVTPMSNQAVFQRIGTSRAVPVGAHVTGPAGTSVEARRLDEAGNPLTDWGTIGVTDANGNASSSILVPQGSWYRWQVRVAGSQTLVSTDAGKWGVGAVIGLAGQSNMYNFMLTGLGYPLGHPRSIMFSDTNTCLRLGNVKDTLPPNSTSSTPGYPSTNSASGSARADGPVYLANMLAMELGVPVMLVEKAKSGSNITSWTDGTATNWVDFRNKIIAAGGDMEAMFWYQGETNAVSATQTYMTSRWDILLTNCLALTGRTTATFKIGMVSLGPGHYQNSVEGQFGAMRIWQRDYAIGKPGWFYATGAHASSCAADTVHIGGQGHGDNGRREARSLMALYGVGVSGAGPRVTGAAWDGSGVVMTLQHAGGTALTDGAGGTGAALTGFEFKDAGGVVMPYTASAITSPTTLRFALPSKPATASYGLMNVPHGVDNGASITFVPASCAFDNVAMPNMVYGCPLQPCAAMNIV